MLVQRTTTMDNGSTTVEAVTQPMVEMPRQSSRLNTSATPKVKTDGDNNNKSRKTTSPVQQVVVQTTSERRAADAKRNKIMSK